MQARVRMDQRKEEVMAGYENMAKNMMQKRMDHFEATWATSRAATLTSTCHSAVANDSN